MSESAWQKLGFAALAVIIFVCTLVVIRWAIEFITWSNIDSGWAQAIGAVAAIGVAIWVAHRDSRERRDERHAVAIVAAIEMHIQVDMLLLHLNAIKNTAEFAMERGSDPGDFKTLLDHTNDWPYWTVEEIARLAPLPNRCALNLAQGMSTLYGAKAMLEASVAAAENLSTKSRDERLKLLQKFCDKARKQLYGARMGMSSADIKWRE
jgi:hypothetical protein